jgi:acetyl esterase/lipase
MPHYQLQVLMRPMFRAVLLAALALVPAACSLPVDALNATISRQGLTIVPNVPYEPGARHAMDVYRANNAVGARPVVVFIYGGAWQTGDKDDYLFVGAALARAGFVVVIPDYRVYPDGAWPVFEQDAAQAVATVQRSAASWGGDPGRVFLVGHSAGAHIAAMLALNPAFLQAAGGSRDHLAGVVGISGPYDFLPITMPDIQRVFASAAGDPRVTQPITYVDGHNPPMLLLQGEADDTVQPRNTTSLATAIRADGGPVEVKLYPGVSHIGTISSFAPLLRDRSPSLADTVAFINAEPAVAPLP